MEAAVNIRRRDFIKWTGMTGTLLAIGCVPSSGEDVKTVNLNQLDAPGIALNPYIFINTSGKVTLFNHRPEMGQGTYQAIPMILAEELEVNIEDVEIQQSPADREKYGDQMVVGSRSIQSQFDLLRKVGAAGKHMLIQAAAHRWNASPEDCYAENATVIHRPSGKQLPYGELVEEASQLPAPGNPKLKDPKDFKIIGQSLPRRDTPLKTSGRAIYGSDVQVPGMLYATVERSPVFLGKIVSFDDEKAKAVPGVKYVLQTQRNVWGHNREGVAVVADSYWAAVQGRKALKVRWDNADYESYSTESIKEDYRKASQQKGVALEEKGNFDNVFAQAEHKVEAAYETPYQSHAPMESMNATVHVRDNECEFWGSTQNPNGIRSALAKQLDIPEENVLINYTFMGCGFGRRSMTDVAEEAVDLSKKTGAPVQVVWSREDDLTQGPFRACSLNVCKGALDDEGNVVGLEHKVVCQEIRNQTGDNNEASGQMAGGINTEYEIPNLRVSGVLRKFYIPITYWRSVYHSTNCFAHESFIDELAHAAGKDPLDFRLSLLKNHPRYTKVLQTVAEKAGWHQPRKPDTGRGVAIVERSGAFVAMVAEVGRIDGKVKPTKITIAVDCGMVVNPDTVKAQTEGSAVMGLTAAYKSGLTIKNGAVVEQNFDTYKMLELAECPDIEVFVIQSNDPPEGAGEAGLPTVAPALTNAIFDLTGERIRALPFNLEEV